jgi:hypothetical protein
MNENKKEQQQQHSGVVGLVFDMSKLAKNNFHSYLEGTNTNRKTSLEIPLTSQVHNKYALAL